MQEKGFDSAVYLCLGPEAALAATGEHGRRAEVAGQDERDDVGVRPAPHLLDKVRADRLQPSTRIERGFDVADQCDASAQRTHGPSQ